MPLYSASQLLDKTLLLEKTVNVYKAIDIINFGDTATPVGTLKAGNTFQLDSFMLPTEAYVNQYGIHYAKRDFLYFTYFNVAGTYLSVRVTDGIFSLAALRDQGVLTVKEQREAEERENMNPLERFFNDLFGGGTFGTVVIIAAVAIGGGYLLSRKKSS